MVVRGLAGGTPQTFDRLEDMELASHEHMFARVH